MTEEEEERKFYNLKLKTKHTWAKCIINNRFAAGVSTTSRIESMHKVLKDNLNSKSKLSELFEAFVKIELNQIESHQEEFQRYSKNVEMKSNNCVLVQELAKTYCPYILKKISQKINKALSYKQEELIPEKSW